MGQQDKQFLVVDDFEPMRKTVTRMLSAMGHTRVHLAGSGITAMKILQTEKIDYLISDWNMPGMDGLELLKLIRSDSKLGSLPVMMITAEAERDRIIRALEAGVTEIIIKPFTPNTFRNKLNRIITGKTPVVPGRRKEAAPAAKGAVSAGASDQAQANDRREGGKRSVLVVDDEACNIDLARTILGSEFNVKAATSGERCLAVCQSESPPDLILLDVVMPNMDGYETCRKLKADQGTAFIPVIFFSAMGEAEDMTSGFTAGGVDYIHKPPMPEVMLARVRAHMKLREHQYQLERQLDLQMSNFRLLEDVERMTRHDLKGPLSVVIHSVEELRESPSEASLLDEIGAAAQLILQMINNTLDVYKMEQGTYKLNAKALALLPLLKQAIKICQPSSEASGVNVALDESRPVTLMAEEMLCIPLFVNLLKNAIEASPAGKEVSVKIQTKAAMAAIEIHNMGAIPEAIRDHFFDKYVTSGKEGGSGLGTYSAQLMATTMQGKIEFTSSKEEGTTLTVSLPQG
ncbi:MAG: hybrid sensor histidine kinase/response regulator [Gammaproteobacteria bacterium]|nr:hybrid sensor histidine kinase/response regulator [Gammaproteobacteria bacterium]